MELSEPLIEMDSSNPKQYAMTNHVEALLNDLLCLF